VREIAGISMKDGIEFDPEQATAEVIREEHDYSGVRVTLGGTLSRAMIRLHVAVNVGDPIWPEPQHVSFPTLDRGPDRGAGQHDRMQSNRHQLSSNGLVTLSCFSMTWPC
jgi:hypothetical protein